MVSTPHSTRSPHLPLLPARSRPSGRSPWSPLRPFVRSLSPDNPPCSYYLPRCLAFSPARRVPTIHSSVPDLARKEEQAFSSFSPVALDDGRIRAVSGSAHWQPSLDKKNGINGKYYPFKLFTAPTTLSQPVHTHLTVPLPHLAGSRPPTSFLTCSCTLSTRCPLHPLARPNRPAYAPTHMQPLPVHV